MIIVLILIFYIAIHLGYLCCGLNLSLVYSQLSLNGHLYKTDNSLRQTLCVGPSRLSVILL